MVMAAPMRTTTARRRMTTDFLTLNQLMSPAFPVGAFAYSHGVEAAIESGQISSAQTLEAWLRALVQTGGGYADAALLNVAFQTEPSAIEQVDAQARAFAASAERWKETDLQGAAFCDTVRDVWDLDLPRLCYPVAVGYVARCMELPVQSTTAMFLQAFVANLTAAGLRLVPLGQLDGQKIQAALMPLCRDMAEQLVGAQIDDVHSATWASDIAAMRHETQYSRIFRT